MNNSLPDQALQQVDSINAVLMQIVSFKHIIPTGFRWIALLFLVVFFTLLINLILKYFITKGLARLAKRSNTIFDDTVIEVMHKPVRAFTLFSGFLWALQVMAQYNHHNWDNHLLNLWRLSITVCFGWFLLRLIKAVEANILTKPSRKGKPKPDSATVMAVARLLRLSIIITLVLVTLQDFGFSISGVLAFGGIGGIAIGFAARDLLANFFGGFMIFIDKPFHVGDWISSPDRQIEGTVEYIGWRMTRIRTFDLRPLYIPNSIFMNIAVENPSRMLNRRINENLGLRYEDLDKMPAIVADIKQMITNHPAIDNRRTIIVAFDKYNDYSLNIMLYCFTKTVVWVEFYEKKQQIMMEIKDIVHKHGADFAFPTQELIISQASEMPADPLTSGQKKPALAEIGPEPSL